jgi:predicted dinucleotide-binding enzyme
MTSIAVIGSGKIGATIGEAWRRAGHDVTHASRSPQPPQTSAIADAIALADVALLATPGAAVPELIAAHGAALNGRVVIDATNDVGAERLHQPTCTPPSPRALGSHAPSIPSALRDVRRPNRRRRGGGPLLVRADDTVIEQLIADVGLRPVRVGDIDAIDVVDGVGQLWLTLVFRQGHECRRAFRMLTD